MKKIFTNLRVGLIIFGVFVVGILAYISLLGENQQINRVVATYFDKLKDGMYLEACESFSSNFQFQDERFASAVRPLAAAIARLDDDFKARRLDKQVYREERRVLEERLQEIFDNFNFLVESTLLTHYNLIDSKDYEVELKGSHFWLPYSGNDVVRVSVLLKKKEARRFFLPRSKDRGGNPVNNLIIMVREKGTWKIKEFALADSSVAGIYNDLRQNLDLNKYVQMTPGGFRFNNAEINFKTLTPFDKRLLNFSLYKMQKLLGASRKKTQGFPIPH
jgi:outer membrane murein-binding lipoprotein Lpp